MVVNCSCVWVYVCAVAQLQCSGIVCIWGCMFKLNWNTALLPDKHLLIGMCEGQKHSNPCKFIWQSCFPSHVGQATEPESRWFRENDLTL